MIIVIIFVIISKSIILPLLLHHISTHTYVRTHIRSAGSGTASLTSDLFFSSGFKSFYETQVETVRKDIFEIYSGGQNKGGSAEEFSLREIVAMQKDKIQELEEKILVITGSGDSGERGSGDDHSVNKDKSENENENENENGGDGRSEEVKEEMQKLFLRIIELEDCLTELEKQKKEIEVAAFEANEKLFEQMRNLAASESKILQLEEELEARAEDLGGMVRGEAVIAAEADSLRRRAESAEKTGVICVFVLMLFLPSLLCQLLYLFIFSSHFYPAMHCTALPYPTLPYPTLPYPTLPYPALPFISYHTPSTPCNNILSHLQCVNMSYK